MIVTTNASAADDTILKKFQKAPFEGVLVGETRYQQYTSAMDLLDYYKKYPCPEPGMSDEEHDQEKVYYAIGGILTGLVFGLAIGSK